MDETVKNGVMYLFCAAGGCFLIWYLLNNSRREWKDFAAILGFFFVTLAIIILAIKDTKIAAAIGSLAIIASALLAWSTIIANRNLKIKDSNEHKLKEIIEWAIDATNGKLTDEIKRLSSDIQYVKNLREELTKADKPPNSEQRTFIGKSRYIYSLTASIKNINNLLNSIVILNDELYLIAQMESEAPPDRMKIYRAANHVIDDATALL
jgi:drug/metabolite transporter superfamily protein YnfA